MDFHRSFLIDTVYLSVTEAEKLASTFLQHVKGRISRYKKPIDGKNDSIFTRYLGLRYLLIFMFLPWYLLYWCYWRPLLYVSKTVLSYLLLPVAVLRRRSQLINSLATHVHAILRIWDEILHKLLTSQVSELVTFCVETALEIVLAMLWPFQHARPTPPPPQKDISVGNMSELVYYEERAADDADNALQTRRSVRSMHNFIPLNPFRATVRVENGGIAEAQSARMRSKSVPRTPRQNGRSAPVNMVQVSNKQRSSLQSLVSLPWEMLGLWRRQVHSSQQELPLLPSNDVTVPTEHESKVDLWNADSPASFPPTPFSRAYVLNRASERVVSVMFAARDKLRLEALSVSRDEYSRAAAQEAQTSGQMAVFDARQTSTGIVLSCGNHCAAKVGAGLVSSCRAMMSVRPHAFVYFEFSVTVSSSQLPELAIGLAPPDHPLNVVVGSWARSVGLLHDGNFMVDSRAFSAVHPAGASKTIQAGSTIGILTYLPSGTTHSHLAGAVVSPESGIQPELIPPPRGMADVVTGRFSRAQSIANATDSPAITGHGRELLLQFHIDGEAVPMDSNMTASLQELLSFHAPLFPTVSLLSEDTRVWCRFCEADVVFRDRTVIRAPPNVRVYCLDGSLLLNEQQ